MNLKLQKIFCKPDMKNIFRALRFAGWYAIVPIMYALFHLNSVHDWEGARPIQALSKGPKPL